MHIKIALTAEETVVRGAEALPALVLAHRPADCGDALREPDADAICISAELVRAAAYGHARLLAGRVVARVRHRLEHARSAACGQHHVAGVRLSRRGAGGLRARAVLRRHAGSGDARVAGEIHQLLFGEPPARGT